MRASDTRSISETLALNEAVGNEPAAEVYEVLLVYEALSYTSRP
jgi:hypothetical protein